MTPLDDDRPTLLLFGAGEPMLDALVAALSGRAIVTVEVHAESAVVAVLANVPDVTIFVGHAAEPDRAATLLRELGAHALTATSPVALLSSDDSLAARLRAAEHGVVTILQRSPSADAMARQMLELATRLYDDPGVHEAGELAEASVDDLVQILGRELQSGILSITQADGARAERFVVRAGQPMRAAITQFIDRVRPLIAEAKPLHYAFHEAPVAPLWTLDDEAEAERDGCARKGLRDRRFLLIANNPAAADALAQELRANAALVVVVSADGSGWDRARDLDPEIALIDEEGLNHWGFEAVAQLRADPQLRWASLVVMDAKELLPKDGPPRVERLAANIVKLTEPDAALRARAAVREVFDTRIETVGPTRLVRALLSTGGAWNLHVRPRGGATLQLALAEGLVAGATAHLPDGRRIEAAAAFACLLVAGAGRMRVEPAAHPKLANMLMPLDEAVRAAHAEGSPVPVTHSPSAPPPPIEHSSRPSSPPRVRSSGSQVQSTETTTLVGQLEELVGGLHNALEGQPTRPKIVARVAAPMPPMRPPGVPTGSPTAAAPTAPKKPALAAAGTAPPESAPRAATPPATVRAAAVAPRPTASPLGPAAGATTSPTAPIRHAAPADMVEPASGNVIQPASASIQQPAVYVAGGAKPTLAASPKPSPAASPKSSPAASSKPSRAASPKPSPAASAEPSPSDNAKPATTEPAPRPAAAASAQASARPPMPAARGAAAESPTNRTLRPPPSSVATSLRSPAPAAAAPPTTPSADAKSLAPRSAAAKSLSPPPASATHTSPPPGAGPTPRAQGTPSTRPPPPAPARTDSTPTAMMAPAAPAMTPQAPTMPPRPPAARRPAPMPQPPPAALPPLEAPQAALAEPIASDGPRRLVSPAHLAVALAVVLAGVAGFALVLTFAAPQPASPPTATTPAPAAVALETRAPTPAPPAVAPQAPAAPPAAATATPPAPMPAASPSAMPAPTPAPSATAALPETSGAVELPAPHAPRLPSVDPGPMPEEHAGAAAMVERYRDSLARGARARSRGDLDEALAAYRFAVHLKPRSPAAILGLARTYLDAQQPADALRWAERARDVETRGIEGRLMVGDVLLMMGQHDRAIASWREAQTVAPLESAPEERIRRAEEALAEDE